MEYIYTQISRVLCYVIWDLDLLRIVSPRFVVDFQKGGTLAFLLVLMHVYGNFSIGVWVYTALHGSYGLLWCLKDFAFTDETVKAKVSVIGLGGVVGVLMGYWGIAWMMVAGFGDENPSGLKIAVCIVLYITGVTTMMISDAQKTFVRAARPGLIDFGMFAHTRNPNYLGEIMVYLSFALIVNNLFAYAFLLLIWSVLFMSFMIKKDASLARKPGWEEYARRSWLLLPKVVPNSSVLSVIVYTAVVAIVILMGQ